MLWRKIFAELIADVKSKTGSRFIDLFGIVYHGKHLK